MAGLQHLWQDHKTCGRTKRPAVGVHNPWYDYKIVHFLGAPRTSLFIPGCFGTLTLVSCRFLDICC